MCVADISERNLLFAGGVIGGIGNGERGRLGGGERGGGRVKFEGGRMKRAGHRVRSGGFEVSSGVRPRFMVKFQ